MEAKTLIIGGLRLIHGVAWVPLIGQEDESKEVAGLVSQYEASLQVRLEHDTSVVYGFLAKDSVAQIAKDGKSKKKAKGGNNKDLFSFGAILAGSCQSGQFRENAVFIMQSPTDDDEVLLLRIQNGLPASGGELVVSHDKVRETISGWIQGGRSFDILTDTDHFPESAHQINFAWVIQRAPDIAKKESKFSKAKLPFDKKKAIIIGVIAVGATIVMWDDIYRMIVPPPPPPPPPNYAKMYAEGVNSLLVQAGVPGGEFIVKMMDSVATVPMAVGGWNTDKVVCHPATGCEVLFKPKIGFPATNQTFMETKPENASNVQFAIDGKRISINWGSIQELALAGERLKRETLPMFFDFKQTDFSKYQELSRIGVGYSFEEPTVLGVSGVVINKVPPELIIKRGSFTLSGKAWMLQEFPMAGNMVINEVEINTSSPTEKLFTIKGSYYVR